MASPKLYRRLMTVLILVLMAGIVWFLADARWQRMFKEWREESRTENAKQLTRRFVHDEEVVAVWLKHLDSLEYQRHIEDSLKQVQADLEAAEIAARVREHMKKYKPKRYGSSTQGSDYEGDGHPGTKPDDPLFGFDPWDDEDDAYNLERNIIDPYPGEW